VLPREAFTEPSVQTLVAQKLRAYVPFLVPFGKLAKRLLKVRARVGRPRGLGSRSLEPSPVLDPFPSFRELESVLPRSNPSLFGRVVSVRSLPSFGTRRVVDQLSSRACPAASRLVRRPSRGARATPLAAPAIQRVGGVSLGNTVRVFARTRVVCSRSVRAGGSRVSSVHNRSRRHVS
jgi:hypothetical protein